MTNLHSARLISITTPVPEIIEELGVNSSEGLAAYIARISNPSNQSNDQIKGLLSYCVKNQHWSVFESCFLSVEITTTSDIATQILRHRSMTFQQHSLRYSSIESHDCPYEYPEFRLQDTKNRQKSINLFDALMNDHISSQDLAAIDEKAKEAYDLMDEIYEVYKELLELNVAKETARRILPVAHVTRLYMSGSIRSFVFYIKARNSTDGKSQLEHQKVADSIEAIFKEQFPIVYSALFSN